MGQEMGSMLACCGFFAWPGRRLQSVACGCLLLFFAPLASLNAAKFVARPLLACLAESRRPKKIAEQKFC